MATPHLRFPPAGTPTITTVTSVLADVLLIVANVNRLGLLIVNDSRSRLNIRFGTAPASLTDWSRILVPGEPYFVDASYTGEIRGIWQSTVSGLARLSEFTA